MGILDEAIREHLELKRQHGADDSELKQLEDEAFGSPERPGQETGSPASEAPTQFMAEPGVAPPEEPPPAEHDAGAEAQREATARRESAARIADLQEPPQAPEPERREEPSPEQGIVEEQPGAEAVAEEPIPPPVEERPPSERSAEQAPEPVSPGPSTEERRAIAEHPTEMYDVETEAGAPEAEAEAEAAKEQDFEEEEDEEFWSEQRLSDELDQALEAPIDLEPEPEREPEREPEPEPEAHDEPEAHEDHEDEVAHEEDEEGEEPRAAAHRDEDVLEDTPEFLEESPEDDELWFEQKPPKDFDFDD